MKILVADDEQPARKKIISFLNELEEKLSIEEASNGKEAIKIINNEKPDLVLLDIQMPGMNGFEVIEKVGIEEMPAVIFITAYDQYALNAFEVHAVDYLLKPFDKERFYYSFNRAKDQIELKKEQKNSLELVINELKKKEKYLNRILVNVGTKYFFIKTSEIIYISSEEKYVKPHTEKGNYLIRDTMNNIENSLDPSKFYRVHRSYIVNIEWIKEMRPWSHGDYVIYLKNGEKIHMSRRYKERLFN